MDGLPALTTLSSILRGSGENEVDQGRTGEAQSRKTYKDLDSPGKNSQEWYWCGGGPMHPQVELKAWSGVLSVTVLSIHHKLCHRLQRKVLQINPQ